jgi:hypothetical protein
MFRRLVVCTQHPESWSALALELEADRGQLAA